MFAFGPGTPDSIFTELWRLQEQVDELFGTWTHPSGGIRSLPRGSFPAVNIGHTHDRVDIYLFAPGIDPKRLELSIQQNLLTVAGQRAIPAQESAAYYRQERFNGDFHRVVALPDDVDPDKVDAQYQDGIVHVSVQRRAAARPRQIEIR